MVFQVQPNILSITKKFTKIVGDSHPNSDRDT